MNLQRNDFIELVKSNVANVSEERLEAITLDDKLADVGIDSLGFATLLFAIEDKLEIRLEEQFIESLNGESTIADLVAAIRASGREVNV